MDNWHIGIATQTNVFNKGILKKGTTMKNTSILKVLFFLVTTLLASGGWGFETDKNSIIKGNLTLNPEATSADTSAGAGNLNISGNILLNQTTAIDNRTESLQIKTSHAGQLYLSHSGAGNDEYWRFGVQDNGVLVVYQGSNNQGVYLNSSVGSWATNSDERLKEIIEPISDAATKVSRLRAVIGRYKTDDVKTRRSFLIAQDVQAILPEAVSVKDDSLRTLGVSYTDTIPLLVAAIKEQQQAIQLLTERVKQLENN